MLGRTTHRVRRGLAPRPLGHHPGGNLGANLKSISHRFFLREVAFERDLTKKPYIYPWVVSRVVWGAAWADSGRFMGESVG
jgi:hypothetical protein